MTDRKQPGFVITCPISFTGRDYTPEQRAAFERRFTERMRELLPSTFGPEFIEASARVLGEVETELGMELPGKTVLGEPVVSETPCASIDVIVLPEYSDEDRRAIWLDELVKLLLVQMETKA